jgi:hypothetical protein
MIRGKSRWRCCVFLLLLVLPGSGLLAQSVSDVIQQLVMDVQKLSQLKQILSEMQQGYAMVKKGYEDIKGLSQGTFSLHKAFLDGLLAVSPVVSSYAKVADIISKEARLVKDYQAANGYFRNGGRFTSQEMGAFGVLYGNLLQRGVKNVNELWMVITDGQLRMSDAERLSAIDRIDQDMTQQLSFLHTFNNNVALQEAQRLQARQDAGTVRALYGIGP